MDKKLISRRPAAFFNFVLQDMKSKGTSINKYIMKQYRWSWLLIGEANKITLRIGGNKNEH